MHISEMREVDYSDNRIDSMAEVLDSVDVNAGMSAFFNSIILPFADSPDWEKLAEWNCNSIYGVFARHLEACETSLDKTVTLLRQAMSEDVGTEISTQKIDKLLFRRNAQELNIKRANMILDAFKLKYETAFGKKYVPVSKSGSANVQSSQIKEYNMARLQEALKTK
tara:strand:- start:14 stop:514 length:501 start_codon:yes stop_codon:yes gene_type:complete